MKAIGEIIYPTDRGLRLTPTGINILANFSEDLRKAKTNYFFGGTARNGYSTRDSLSRVR